MQGAAGAVPYEYLQKQIPINMTHSVFNLNMPNDIKYLAVVLGYVKKLADLAGFDARGQREMELAVEEAVVNVILHAFEPGTKSSFDIRCEILPAYMLVAVHDQGIPFDAAFIPEYYPPERLEDRANAGLGSFLIKRLVDRIEYCNMGSAGKETRLLKYLPCESVTDQSNYCPDYTKSESKCSEEFFDEIEVRGMKPEEAVEISRCFFDTYGYSYIYEDIYFPERIAALNKSKELFSVVAVNNKGTVLNHNALVFSKHFPGIAEVAMGATRPKYQGRGLAAKTLRIVFDEAINRKLKGLYVNAVCIHTFSQKIARRNGFQKVCFLLAHSIDTTRVKGIADKLPDRGAILVYYLPLKTITSPLVIHTPARHRNIILDLYRNIGMEPYIGELNKPGELSGKSQLELSINKRRQTAVLLFDRYGQDIFDRIHDALYQVKKERVLVVEAYLKLNDPHTPDIAAHMEGEKFLFTGIMPGVNLLVMQYFNGIVVNYDAICLDGDKSGDLLNYIRANDPMETRHKK